jgi:NAD(P)H-flavin reductase
VLLTLTIQDIIEATPRARAVRLDLAGRPFDYLAGQALLVGPQRRPYSLAASPEECRRAGSLELLVGVDADGARARTSARTGRDGRRGGPARILHVPAGAGRAPVRLHRRRHRHRPLAPCSTMRWRSRTNRSGSSTARARRTEFAYESEFRALAQEDGLSSADSHALGRRRVEGRGAARIGRAELQSLVHDPATLCFICGPPALVAATSGLVHELRNCGSRIQIERWG